MTHDGDARQGARLFEDLQGLACARCHTVDGTGLKAGPDLSAAGDRLARRELIDAILTPSAAIAVGYATTIVETRDGNEHQGVLKQASDTVVELASADGQRVRIPASNIRSQRGSTVSLMPEGLQARLTLQEFTDLIEHLVALKQPEHSLTTHHGMPERIPQLQHPAALEPVLSTNLHTASVPGPVTPTPQTGLVWFQQIPGQPDQFLALHQVGVMWHIDLTRPGGATSRFADFTSRVFSARGPNGLLGLAFHPRFTTNRKYYVKYQILDAGRITTVVEERVASPDARQDSGAGTREILRIPSRAEHHNGGCLAFGPDGFLYIGMGDSAPNFDPQGHGQDLSLLLGKMLRIDVDHPADGRAYGIPRDNPFRNRPSARPEIWAYGFREPWRFSFDRATGRLWAADLGQERGDEIDVVRRGANYGWSLYEGFELFAPGHTPDSVRCVQPLFSTRRRDGSCMIGGCVYRGDRRSSFHGVYLFGDYQSRRLWGMTERHGALQTVREIGTCPESITSIVPDEQGRIFVTGYQGMVYRVDLDGARFD
jgi:putative heme-binding domain-containing protein